MYYKYKMKELRNCQINAINCFKDYFYGNEKNKNAIICMCCGSGKTIISYEIIFFCIDKQN